MRVEIAFDAEHLIQLHTKCFSAWECERDGIEQEVRAFARRVVGILSHAQLERQAREGPDDRIVDRI